MSILIWIPISTFLVSIIFLVGVLALAIKERILEKILLVLVALAAPKGGDST